MTARRTGRELRDDGRPVPAVGEHAAGRRTALDEEMDDRPVGDGAGYDWGDFEATLRHVRESAGRPPPRRAGPLTGGVLAAAMLGLAEVLEPAVRQPAPVIAPAPPSRPGPIRVVLDPSPRRSVAVVPAS